MRGLNAVTIGAAILVSTVALSGTRSLADPRVADLVQAGKIRLALFLPLYAKDAATGELRWVTTGIVSIDLMRAFAARLGVEVQLAGYLTPPEVVACLKSGTCDVGIMGVTPGRAAEVDLSPPFLQIDFTFLVPAGSSIRNLADADRPGSRIAVVRNHASTLALSRLLKNAEQVEADTLDAAFDGCEADVRTHSHQPAPRCSTMHPTCPAHGCWTSGTESTCWRWRSRRVT